MGDRRAESGMHFAVANPQRGGAATKRHLKRKDAKTQRSQRTEAEGDDSADFEDFAAFVPKDGGLNKLRRIQRSALLLRGPK